MSWVRVVLFVALALLVLFGMHRYFWARIVRDPRWSRSWTIALTALVVLLGLSIPVTMIVGRNQPEPADAGFLFASWMWSGVLFYAVLWIALFDLVLFILFRRPKPSPMATTATAPDLGRRELLRRVAAGGALAGSGAVAWIGHRNVSGEILMPEVEVTLERLPRALAGYRIAQLSDIHIGPLLGERFLRGLVEQTNAKKPDLIVITGDLVDGTVSVLQKQVEPIFDLRARHGVYFVTGNHEYYSGADEWLAYLRKRGIRVLQNERVSIGDAGASFDLAGIPDASGERYGADHLPSLEKALAGRDSARELVLLAHQPAQIYHTRGKNVGLQLSGHTHGGQLWPFGALVLLGQPYLHGLHRHDPRTQIYVSRGAGFWGPPMRVGNPAEIAQIILV